MGRREPRSEEEQAAGAPRRPTQQALPLRELRGPGAAESREDLWREHLLWRALSLALMALLLLGLVVGIDAWERASRAAPAVSSGPPAPPAELEWRIPQNAPLLTTALSASPPAGRIDPIVQRGVVRRCYAIERVMLQDGGRVVAEGRVCLTE